MSIESQAALVIHPGRPSRKPGAILSAAGWCVFSLVFLLRFHGLALILMALIDVAVVVGTLAISRRSYARSQLTLAHGRLMWSGAIRDRVVFDKSRPGRVVEAEVRWFKTSDRRTRVWLLVDAEGRAEVNLNVSAWDHAQLENLRQRLGVPRELISDTLSGKELRARRPASVPWAVLHPIAMTYLLIAAIVVAVLLAQHL
jgi:hypothetical protein